MKRTQDFAGERVALMEIKSGKFGITDAAIGQLLVYRHLFSRNWPTATIEQLWLLGDRVQNAAVDAICRSVDIKTWTIVENSGAIGSVLA